MRLRHAICQRDHHHHPVPEVLALVVLHQPGADAAGLADVHTRQANFRQLAQQKIHAHLLRFRRLDELAKLAARHFDDANDACRDFSHAHATRVASREEDLDGLGTRHWI